METDPRDQRPGCAQCHSCARRQGESLEINTGLRIRFKSVNMQGHTWTRMLYWTVWTLLLLVKHGTAQDALTQEFYMAEEEPVGAVIGVVGAGIASAPPPYFFFFDKTVNAEKDINFNRDNGSMTVNRRIDREAVASYELVAVSAAQGQNIRVIIYVSDINDNSPAFPEPVKYMTLLESTPRDAKYALGSAVDPDLDINTTQRYEIVSGNIDSVFRVAMKRAPNGYLYLDLEINGQLDYEEISSYALVIRAYDGGSPPRYGELAVNITIVDANDNQPIFNQSRYIARVLENATVGTNVLQVMATDRDTGDNGRVRYEIDRHRSDQDEQFAIDEITGMVSVKKELDYESKSTYELIVVAKDNGSGWKLQTTAVVSVQVGDVNDNEPEISLIFLTSDGTGRISETAEPGDYVARISVSDPDLEGSLVNVTLDGGWGHFGLTTQDNIVYLVILSHPLDRESRPVYHLQVRATDSGTPPLTAVKEFTLHIIDINDNPPEFSQNIYYADIQEVVPPGSPVIHLTAIDPDANNNSAIFYQILHSPESNSDWFQINNHTGLITTRSRVDCETQSELRFTVVASDSGVPPLSGSTTVVVRIRDVNDNQPVFDQSFYNVTVPEDTAINQCILQVEASDPDCGVSAGLEYSVATNLGFQTPRHFVVRRDSGWICISQSLDFETKQVYDFALLAKDEDGLDSTAMVKITVQDVNDNRPILYPTQYSVNLDLDSSVNTEVVVVQATDGDSGSYGAVTYHISQGNDAQLFEINSNTGVLRLVSPLPTTARVFVLEVSARDGGGLTSASTARVTVSILDSSQHPPEFSLSLYTFRIPENANTDTSVGQVEATTPSGDAVTYSITSGDPQGFFEIVPASGELRVRGDLDHDTVPSVLLNIRGQAGSPPTYGQAQVNVFIGDVNDNVPEFAVTEYIEIPVKEDTPVTSTVYVVQATDRDSSHNGLVQYELTDPSHAFTINEKTGQITLLKALDYESQKRHELEVTAYDMGQPSLKATLNIAVSVQDVNDNAPVFTASSYTFSISEAENVNKKFGRVNATDADTNNNGRVTYVLHNGQHMDVFGVFPEDGYLYNKVRLDREQEAQYILKVLAVDNGIPSQAATATVTIKIQDANDNDPKFTQESYNFHIIENQAPHSQVGFVAAYDPDESSTLLYTILTPGLSSTLRIDPSSGELVTLTQLDREQRETYDLRVKVSDQGRPVRTAEIAVRVTVLDQNDNSPTFERSGHYVAYVKERLPKGTLVLQLTARDPDKGENGSITYIFPTGDTLPDSQMFSIHPSSGRLTTNAVLDHESKNQYVFHVVAKDGASPPRQTLTTVEVVVEDENESPPQFDRTHEMVRFKENTPPGTVVKIIKARDTDSGENGRVFYYIVWGNLFGTFGINQTTGALFVARPVDYEECSLYSLQIKAMDNSPVNPMSSIINVNISIIDVNDNPPKFEKTPYVIRLRENIPANSHIETLIAVDMDSGPRGNVRYSIASQSPAGNWFKINPDTGFLTTAKELDHEVTSQITIVVNATDQPGGAEEALFSTVTAHVLIDDVNDNAPVFQSRNEVDILEDEPVNYPVMHIISTDQDSHENGRVTYSIVAGNEQGYFSLNPSTGLLTLAKMLDREAHPIFQLNISAQDNGYPCQTSYMKLTAHVADVNDNAPQFDKSVYKANISENVQQGSPVIRIHATDLDTGENARLEYLLPSGSADDHFTINSHTGEISTNAELDRETVDTWVVTAYVRDSAFPALYDTTTVMVSVKDVNDNEPVFHDSVYNLEVPENSKMSVIHQVVATDRDAGGNGRVQYSIVGGNDDMKFSINPLSGELSCLPLDRETRSLYNLTVVARDSGSPVKSSIASILISVLDVNDNNPVFNRPSYARSISEDRAVGSSVLRVQATDQDIGNNSVISYKLDNNAHGQFRVENSTGIIYTQSEFDREKKSSYSFQVFAIDGGLYGPRSESVQVEITIEDANDNAPIFEEIPYKAEISQDHGVDQYVVQVTAVDRDIGLNGKVMYSLLTTTQYFSIHRDTGVISTKRLLADPSAVMNHRLEVLAQDKGDQPKSSTGVVEIKVGNAQGATSLRFSNHTYTVALNEHSSPKTTVVRVAATFLRGGPGTIMYSFAAGNEDNKFDIDAHTGVVEVVDPAKLDYEVKPRLRLIVVATSHDAYGYTTVWVNLKDINDNAPRFTQDRYNSAVWEENVRGTYVTQVIAHDADSGNNGLVTYSIIGGNVGDAFMVHTPESGIIQTRKILDREIVASYRLVIEAIDGGSIPRSSTAILKIQVIDENDNAPFFPFTPPISIKEGTELGTMVTQVTANDNDLNPVLTYKFLPGGNPGNAFSIDLYSGKIAVAKKLDYETAKLYQLKIVASDEKHNMSTDVTVFIIDENDNAPTFTEQSYQVTIPEMMEPHSSVISVSASDRDGAENSQITYSMLDNSGFYINPITGVIYTNTTVVFTPAQLHLVVMARDNGRPPRTTHVHVQLQVLDINNHPPVFSTNLYETSVREDEARGMMILKVTATDADEMHENRKIDYSITAGNEAGIFQISQSNGDVLLVGQLDREKVFEYALIVEARDNGDPPHSSSATVLIHVMDVNDNSPQFNQSEYLAAVNESVRSEHFVAQVFAVDQDVGLNGRIEYRIASGNDYNWFDINRDSGVITVRNELDHERQAEQRLIVEAKDSSDTYRQQSAFTTVIIRILDYNEFPPYFPNLLYAESIMENQVKGSYVFTAFADDKDSGVYGIVRYSLSSQSSFTIDPLTGDVKSNQVFNYQDYINSGKATKEIHFTVVATDKGGRQGSALVLVSIVPEVKPLFHKPQYSFTVPGNGKKGAWVGRVQALDKDGKYQGLIVYTFKRNYEYFGLNSSSGDIYVTKDLQGPDENVDRQRRSTISRHRRELQSDNVTLVIVASSGAVSGGPRDEVSIMVVIDRNCAGCGLAGQTPTAIGGTAIVLIAVFLVIAVILVVVIVVMYLRGRKRKRQIPESQYDSSSFETVADLTPPPAGNFAPPPYNEAKTYPHHLHHHNVTTSEVSDQSHSASSGRGSAEENDDVDEEIRMINATPQQAQGLRMPDSGIQQDEDAMSDHSVQNHHEYLARLGIDTSKMKINNNKKTVKAPVGSVESMHHFTEEGGGEGGGIEMTRPYASHKLAGVAGPAPVRVDLAAMDQPQDYYGGDEATAPSSAASLSSIINSEEEFSGSYNWDYLLDWGPQYQPLADVFTEIARLKDENIKPKTKPTQIVPQGGRLGAPSQHHNRSINMPPPIITNAPPRAFQVPQPFGHPDLPTSHPLSANSASNNTINSARTSNLTNVSLPKSPLSYESSFTSPAMSPSFTPSLSPLATRSPSISPLVTPKGIGSVSGSSGHTTPQRGGHRHHANGDIHGLILPSDHEREIQI